jgi:hypothetical protein
MWLTKQSCRSIVPLLLAVVAGQGAPTAAPAGQGVLRPGSMPQVAKNSRHVSFRRSFCAAAELLAALKDASPAVVMSAVTPALPAAPTGTPAAGVPTGAPTPAAAPQELLRRFLLLHLRLAAPTANPTCCAHGCAHRGSHCGTQSTHDPRMRPRLHLSMLLPLLPRALLRWLQLMCPLLHQRARTPPQRRRDPRTGESGGGAGEKRTGQPAPGLKKGPIL